ncbi:MAG: hypothetical protein P8M32_04870 [Phycisphaerales bacterium]|jgi:hypothetical protein|nr:hypothetical protein [Phycisphaerales bacterium]
MRHRCIAVMSLAACVGTATAFDAAQSEVARFDSISVMRIVLSPSLGTSSVRHLRGACPPEVATLTDSDFGPGQYVIQAGFAQGEAAAAAWILPLDRFPLRFDSAEILFATSGATQSTTTEWGVEIWQGTPGNGTLLQSFQSDDLILPHLTMPPGTSGTIIQFMIDPEDEEQIYIQDNGTHTYSVAFRIIQHNQPGSPCISSPPTSANAFPTTDVGGLDSPMGNLIDMVTGSFCVCGSGWNTFQQLPGICTPSGDWVLRSTYTPFGCAPSSGACCLDDGSCEVNSEDACLLQGGLYSGDDSLCADVTCPQPTGACCLESSGACVDSEADVCIGFGGVWHFGEACGSFVCFPEGACCLPDGNCLDALTPEDCVAASGLFRGDSSLCDTENCPAPTSWCCVSDGSQCFDDLEESDCLAFGGLWGPAGSTCAAPDACEVSEPCLGDVDGSGDVGVDDALAVLGDWDQSGDLPADVTGDGIVDVNDLLAVISAWGPC